jgi:hypothetical protein
VEPHPRKQYSSLFQFFNYISVLYWQLQSEQEYLYNK